jgi:hypothetical protein
MEVWVRKIVFAKHFFAPCGEADKGLSIGINVGEKSAINMI